MRSYNPTTTGHKGKLSVLCKRWWRQKPVVYVGGGAITAGCHQQLKETVEALNLPVVCSLMGAGGVSGNASSGAGHAGECTVPTLMTMHNADVIFAVRYDLMTERRIIWQSTAQMPLFCISILILLPFLKP